MSKKVKSIKTRKGIELKNVNPNLYVGDSLYHLLEVGLVCYVLYHTNNCLNTNILIIYDNL